MSFAHLVPYDPRGRVAPYTRLAFKETRNESIRKGTVHGARPARRLNRGVTHGKAFSWCEDLMFQKLVASVATKYPT